MTPKNWGGVVVVLTASGALGQGCPPGTYEYGPATWLPDIEHIVVDHYGPTGPLTPLPADYERAERDVGLIRLAVPSLVGETHVGKWAPTDLLVQTQTASTPKVTCTNTHFQAGMGLLFPYFWHVEFPRVVNVPAMMALYAALPEVKVAEPNWYGGIACVEFDNWMYQELPNGTWRWTILDRDTCGGFGCCQTRWDVAVTAAGSVQVVCAPDCNADGALTVADFGCFQTTFVAGGPYADCNDDGALTVADFGCFQTAFVAGCP